MTATHNNPTRNGASGKHRAPTSVHELPDAIHAERFVLQAACASRDWFDVINETVNAEMFSDGRNEGIYRTLMHMYAAGSAVDPVSLAANVARVAAGSAQPDERYLRDLFDLGSEAINFATHATEMVLAWKRRRLIAIGRDAQIAGYADDADDAAVTEKIADTIGQLDDLTVLTHQVEIEDPMDLALRTVGFIERQMAKAAVNTITGLSSGIEALDRVTLGWRSPEYILIGARTSIGKTSLMTGMVNSSLRHLGDTCAMIFSWEMKPLVLMMRIAASAAGVDTQKAGSGDISHGEMLLVVEEMKRLVGYGLLIVDARRMAMTDVRATIRRQQRRRRVGVIALDYVQRIRVPQISLREPRHIQVGGISSAAFDLAYEMEVPLIMGAQLNRETDKRSACEPRLSDFKECGSIEEDADAVLLIHRPAFYGEKYFDPADMNEPCEGRAKLLLAKRREGRTAPQGVLVAFDEAYSRFRDLSAAELDPHAAPLLEAPYGF